MVGCITQDKWIASLGSFLGEEPSLKSLTLCKARLKWGSGARKSPTGDKVLVEGAGGVS